MTKLLERAVAKAARLPDDQQDAVAAQLLSDLESEQAWERSFAETTDTDLDNLVAFARSQAADAIPTEEWLRECRAEGDGST